MVIKNLLVITIAFLLGLFIVPQAFAANGAVNCQPVYGGGQTCVQAGNVVVNKKVLDPKDANKFSDNIAPTNPFAPTQQVTFQIFVTNSGDSALTNVVVKDILPQYVDFVSGDGTFDASNKTVTYTIAKLAPNETRKLTIQAQIVGVAQITNNTVCVVNQATATANGKTSQDNAQFCIEKQAVAPQAGVAQPGAQPSAPTTTKGGLKVFPAPQAQANPATGPEALVLMALLPAGALGAFLRKRTTIK